MTIDRARLMNVCAKDNGEVVAQCPACAAHGGDSKGEHLIVFADDKFGCVAHPRDKDHNREIVRLVGSDSGPTHRTRRVTVDAYRPPASRMVAAVPRRSLAELGRRQEAAMP